MRSHGPMFLHLNLTWSNRTPCQPTCEHPPLRLMIPLSELHHTVLIRQRCPGQSDVDPKASKQVDPRPETPRLGDADLTGSRLQLCCTRPSIKGRRGGVKTVLIQAQRAGIILTTDSGEQPFANAFPPRAQKRRRRKMSKGLIFERPTRNL